jgi:hypothetical protein
MSPREKHIPEGASRTSICLTAAERLAIELIGSSRRVAKNRRTTINDILVDALWFFFENAEKKTRDQIEALVPTATTEQRPHAKIATMPRLRKSLDRR